MAKRRNLPRPVPIKDVLQELLPAGDRQDLEMRQRLRRVWEEVLPATLLAQTRLIDLRRKELWVEVSDSAWGQELQFLKPQILAALEKALGHGTIKEVRLKVSGEF